MRNKIYSDGTPSREWEDDDEDWETSGEDEVASINERVKKDMKTISQITNIRDRLLRLTSLINLCVNSLDKEFDSILIEDVNIVLLENVMGEIKSIEKELKAL